MAAEPAVEPRQEDLAADLQRGVTEAPSQLMCPDCGGFFKTAQGLARHRSVKHGVKGASRRSRRRTTRRAPTPAVATFDRSSALKLVATNGMVPIGEIERIGAWLEEGEGIFRVGQRGK